ncbi:peptidase inhibitor family I36 protein [Streptomyces sp. NPDC054840]
MRVSRILTIASTTVVLTAALAGVSPAQARSAPAGTGSAVTAARDQIQCPRGFVCIYPEIHFEGQPYVKRATDGSVRHLPDYIRGKGSSVINNSSRTARVYQKTTTSAGTCASDPTAEPSQTCAPTNSTTPPTP